MGTPTHIVWIEHNQTHKEAIARHRKEIKPGDKVHFIGFDAPQSSDQSDLEVTEP